ncbi:molybdenum cofactor guanylyltransferase MobA [Martelella alba]|uniref:Molybdenum cofactor guanylyltransferase n=1 Tax=Martelella alba TaxID=2590451 RepID=A0ABY2SLF2_9HYPH|nr:molybdenum cofactor guanylyltransferase MobA [Martelella alba]TKI04267.1 molybdenum cofactor guanylyltransferase MobA [Martelella alba]
MATAKPTITGIILAGGRSSRMGGQDKGLLLLHGLPLYRHVLAGLTEQVSQVIINANRHQDQYRQSGLTVISDTIADFQGPLAGMLAGLQAAETDWVAFVPCDAPVFPLNLVARLWHDKEDAKAAFAHSDNRDHPAFALLNRALAPCLQRFLAGGDRRVMLFFDSINAARVMFSETHPAFANLNTPDDLAGWAW